MSTNRLLDKEIMEREALFSTCALTQGKLFSFTSSKRIPTIVDLHTGKTTLLNDLLNYDPAFNADDMLSFENDIFILELNGKRLMKFNVKERNCSYFNIDCDNKTWKNYAAFAYYGNNIYVFPVYTDGVIKIDLKKERVQKKKELYLHISEYKKDKKQDGEFTFFWCGCQSGSIVWLFQRSGELVVEYDLESDTWREFELSIRIRECVLVTVYAGYMYILSAEGKIYRWNRKDNIAEEIADCRSTSRMEFVFSRIAVTDKGIFLLPLYGEEIFYMDLKTKNVKKYDSYPEDFRYCELSWSKYYGYCEDDNQYYFAMRSANYILTINKRDGIEKWVKAKLSSYEKYKKVYFSYNRKLLCETEYSIEDILSYMKKEYVEKQCRKNISKGEKIWDFAKSIC